MGAWPRAIMASSRRFSPSSFFQAVNTGNQAQNRGRVVDRVVHLAFAGEG